MFWNTRFFYWVVLLLVWLLNHLVPLQKWLVRMWKLCISQINSYAWFKLTLASWILALVDYDALVEDIICLIADSLVIYFLYVQSKGFLTYVLDKIRVLLLLYKGFFVTESSFHTSLFKLGIFDTYAPWSQFEYVYPLAVLTATWASFLLCHNNMHSFLSRHWTSTCTSFLLCVVAIWPAFSGAIHQLWANDTCWFLLHGLCVYRWCLTIKCSELLQVASQFNFNYVGSVHFFLLGVIV